MDERILALAKAVNEGLPGGSPNAIDRLKKRFMEKALQISVRRMEETETMTDVIPPDGQEPSQSAKDSKKLAHFYIGSDSEDHEEMMSDPEAALTNSTHGDILHVEAVEMEPEMLDGKSSIVTQTEKSMFEVVTEILGDNRRKKKVKKVKFKSRSVQVSLPDGDLSLAELYEREQQQQQQHKKVTDTSWEIAGGNRALGHISSSSLVTALGAHGKGEKLIKKIKRSEEANISGYIDNLDVSCKTTKVKDNMEKTVRQLMSDESSKRLVKERISPPRKKAKVNDHEVDDDIKVSKSHYKKHKEEAGRGKQTLSTQDRSHGDNVKGRHPKTAKRDDHRTSKNKHGASLKEGLLLLHPNDSVNQGPTISMQDHRRLSETAGRQKTTPKQGVLRPDDVDKQEKSDHRRKSMTPDALDHRRKSTTPGAQSTNFNLLHPDDAVDKHENISKLGRRKSVTPDGQKKVPKQGLLRSDDPVDRHGNVSKSDHRRKSVTPGAQSKTYNLLHPDDAMDKHEKISRPDRRKSVTPDGLDHRRKSMTPDGQKKASKQSLLHPDDAVDKDERISRLDHRRKSSTAGDTKKTSKHLDPSVDKQQKTFKQERRRKSEGDRLPAVAHHHRRYSCYVGPDSSKQRTKSMVDNLEKLPKKPDEKVSGGKANAERRYSRKASSALLNLTGKEEDAGEAKVDGSDKIGKNMDGDVEKAETEESALIKDELPDEEEMKKMKMDEDLKPPGDESLAELEELFADASDEKPEDLDPELVAKIEEQIFEKIRFYKEVKSEVREKTWHMRKKTVLLGEAKVYLNRFEGSLASGGGGPGAFAQMKATLTKTSRELGNYLALLVPWEAKVKNIECYFGSVVASYFTFLRWLFWINIVMSVICGVVIIMPEVMFGPEMGTVPYKSVPDDEATEASYFNVLWNFDGYAKVSPIFYGYYSSIKKYDSGFRMPFAYMLGNLMMFGYSFITILRQIAENSKDEKASDKDDNFTFSWKAFTSWDYMIGNEETAKNKYKALVVSIRESITETKESAKKITKTRKFLRVLANFLVLLVLGSSTYAIFLTVERSKEFEKRAKEFGPESVSWVETNEVSLVLSLVTAFFPILFDLIANIEDYHPRVALQWSLRRLMVLYLLNLYTLYIALYSKIQDIQGDAAEANRTFYEKFESVSIIPCTSAATPKTTSPALYNISTNLTTQLGLTTLHHLTSQHNLSYENNTFTSCGIPEFVPQATCWETMVGQELIKLTVFDLVITVMLIYITEFFRACAIRVLNDCWCWDLEKHFPGYAEFSLAENLLHLVYNQGMIWMGTLFCPGLPLLNLIKLLCLFYVRAWSVMVCNVPHERIFKAGSDNFYLILLLFMLYVVMIPIAFAMVSIEPSRTCGPFKEQKYMYNIITEWVKDVFPIGVFKFLKYMTSPGALIPIFILLFLIIYYLSSSNNALQGTVMDLKKQLKYERTEGKKRVFNMKKERGDDAGSSKAPLLHRTSSKPILAGGSKAKAANPALHALSFISKLKVHAAERQLEEEIQN